LPFSISSVSVCGIPGTWRHGNIGRHRHGNMEKWRHGRCGDIKRKTETQAIFLKPFTVCSSYKHKFVFCPFVDKETNWSYPFKNELNGLNGLNRLAHLWWHLYPNRDQMVSKS
jgi:hypothetical protein